MAIPFRELEIGAHFRFTGGSFGNVAKKVSSKCYVWTAKHAVISKKRGKNDATYRVRSGILRSCVGSTTVAVNPTGRRSIVKHRRGRGRGPGKFGRYGRR